MGKHARASLALLAVSYILRWIWIKQGLPYGQIIHFLSVPFALYFVISIYLLKKEGERRRAREQELKDQIIKLCDDTSFKDGFSVEDLTFLYEIAELEKLV